MADGLEMANSSNDSDVIILFNNDEITGSSCDDDEKVSDDDKKVSNVDENMSDDDKKVSDGDENVYDDDKKVSDGDENMSDDDKKVSDGDENVSDDDKNVSDDDDEMSGPPSDIILVDEDIAGTLIKRNSAFKFREYNNMVENSNDRKNVMYLSAEELSEMLNNNRNARCHKVGTSIEKKNSFKFLEGEDMVKTSIERKNVVELSSSRFDSENESSTSENSTPDCDLPIIQKITSKFAVENEPTMSRNSTQDYNLPIIQKITSRFGVENESSSSTKVTQNNYNPLIKQKIATRFNGGNESSSSRNVTDLQQKITSRFNDENGSSRSKGTQNNKPPINQKIASRFDYGNESSSSRNVTDLQQKIRSRFNDENESSRSTKGTQNNNPPFKQKIATRFNDGKESSSSTNVLDVPIKQEVTEVFHGENETSTSNDVTIDCDLQIKHEVLMISDYEYESESSSSDNLGSDLQYVFLSSQQTGSRSVNDFVSSRNEEFLQSVMADKSLVKNGVKQKIEDGWIVADTKDVQPPRMKKCECFYQETFLHPYNVALGPCEDCVIGEKLRSAHKKYVSRWLNSNKPFVPMTLEEVSSTKYIEHWSNCNVKVIGQLAMRSLSLRQRNVAARKLCKEDHDFYLRSVDEDGGPYHVCIDFQMVKRRMPLAGQQIQAYAELRMTPRGEPLLMAMLYRDLHQVDRTMMKSYCHALEQMKTFVPLFVNLKKSGHHDNVSIDEEDELNNPILT